MTEAKKDTALPTTGPLRDLIYTLEDIAACYEGDGKRLREFVAAIKAEARKGTDFKGSYLEDNVVEQVMRLFNLSDRIASQRGALRYAHEVVRDGKRGR